MIVIHTTIVSPGSKVSAQAARVFREGREFTHLMADTEAELREYARKMQIPAAWIQHPGTRDVHFDITGVVLQKVRADREVKQMTLREWSNWRKSLELGPVHPFEYHLAGIPAGDREAVLERAAIMEYEANQTREQAEANALIDWKRQKHGGR